MPNPGIKIYKYRLDRKISQAELAEKAGLAQANLSNIEKGKRDLTVSTLLRIAAALEVRPSQLIDSAEPGDRFDLTRDKIEKLAEVILDSDRKASRELKDLAGLFRPILPEASPRASVKKTNLAWSQLRERLTASEIKGVLDRVRDAEQRGYAKKTN